MTIIAKYIIKIFLPKSFIKNSIGLKPKSFLIPYVYKTLFKKIQKF